MTVKSISYAGKADVYNMEVEDTHNYVVNGGFVVHNCYDAARYMCMFRPVAAERVKRYHTRIRTPYDEDNDDEEAVYGW